MLHQKLYLQFYVFALLMYFISCSNDEEAIIKKDRTAQSNKLASITPDFNKRYMPDSLTKIDLTMFEDLKNDDYTKYRSDSLKQQQIKGLGNFMINSPSAFYVEQFQILDARQDISYEGVIKDITIPTINIAGIDFNNLRLTFFKDTLKEIHLDYTLAPFDKGDSSFDKLSGFKKLFITKYGQPLRYLELVPNSSSLYGHKDLEGLSCTWASDENRVQADLDETFETKFELHNDLHFVPTYRFKLNVVSTDSKLFYYKANIASEDYRKHEVQEENRKLEEKRTKDSLLQSL